MILFDDPGVKWWNKRLVLSEGIVTTAELAVLGLSLSSREEGLWLNASGLGWLSRGKELSGVTGLRATASGYETERALLPLFVADTIRAIYVRAGVGKGCPDLVVWSSLDGSVRFIEVKCPRWDRVLDHQERFMEAARSFGVGVEVVNWSFSCTHPCTHRSAF
ncbi:MAG: VRR-NUC domain-containing protein [Fimbriimonadaceae bacterium]